MIGLIILFLLAIWCLLTVLAMWVGYKIGKRNHFPKTGIFTGFMLVMGGWFVYWAIEFAYIQLRIKELCEKEAGITVYVTPEEWRKQIGEEWIKAKPLTNKEIDEKYQKNQWKTLLFEGEEYEIRQGAMRAGNIENFRLSYYDRSTNRQGSIQEQSAILFDSVKNQVVLKKTYYFSYPKRLGGVNVWFIPKDCSHFNKEFHDIATKYSNHNSFKGF